jgi:hypothetical protein
LIHTLVVACFWILPVSAGQLLQRYTNNFAIRLQQQEDEKWMILPVSYMWLKRLPSDVEGFASSNGGSINGIELKSVGGKNE